MKRWLGVRKRRGIVLTGVAVVGVVLFVVGPAVAGATYVASPPKSTTLNITPGDLPIGGETGLCGPVFGSAASYELDIKNPKSSTYKGVNGVTFDLTNNNDQFLDFTAHGGAVLDFAIKGGTHTNRYNYDGSWAESVAARNPVPGFAVHDTQLHAPRQSSSQLYSISHVTICYSLVGVVSGTVYQDKTVPANGAQDSPADPGLSGWKVNLYKSATAAGPGSADAPLTTTTTDANGKYTFMLPFSVNSYYTICETAAGQAVPAQTNPALPPYDSWAQSQPTPSGKNYFHCTTARGELPNGYQFKATSAAENVNSTESNDFKLGNVGGYSCTQSGSSLPYQVTKECKDGQTYVQSSGVLADGRPFASLFVSDQNLGAKQPIIEEITWPYASVAQNQLTVAYTDLPMSVTNLHNMRYCQVDPTGNLGADPSTILPAPDATNDPEDTSCLVKTSVSVDASSVKQFVADIYSAVDGFRSSPG